MNAQSLRTRFYDSRRPLWIDGTTAFGNLVRQHLRPGMRVLNLGAGPGAGALHFDDRAGSIIGLDPDTAIARNQHLTAKTRGVAKALPFRASVFDLVYFDWVAEHLSDPARAVREIARVLHPGGKVLFRTGNLLHYSYAVARVTPHWFHEFAVRLIRGGDSYEPYPTYYRMNLVGVVRRLMREAGLIEESLTMNEPDPAYMGFSVPSMLAAVAYERLVNHFTALAPMRAVILGCYRLP